MNQQDFPIQLVGADADAVVAAVGKGIDSHLEAFCQSTFEWYIHTVKNEIKFKEYVGNEKRFGQAIVAKLHCLIAASEIPLLIRRLVEISEDDRVPEAISEAAMTLADDIVEIYYGVSLDELELQALEREGQLFCEKGAI